jgi:hypothetical protein
MLRQTIDLDIRTFANDAHYGKLKAQFSAAEILHVIRDPREVVISAYFNHKHTHPTHKWAQLARHRERLWKLPKYDALWAQIRFLECEWITEQPVHLSLGPLLAMRLWRPSDPLVKTVYLEHLSTDPRPVFDFLEREMSPDVPERYAYAKLSKGRQVGEVNELAPEFRSGAGSRDWTEHLSPDHVWYLQEKYGDLFLAERERM